MGMQPADPPPPKPFGARHTHIVELLGVAGPLLKHKDQSYTRSAAVWSDAPHVMTSALLHMIHISMIFNYGVSLHHYRSGISSSVM